MYTQFILHSCGLIKTKDLDSKKYTIHNSYDPKKNIFLYYELMSDFQDITH